MRWQVGEAERESPSAADLDQMVKEHWQRQRGQSETKACLTPHSPRQEARGFVCVLIYLWVFLFSSARLPSNTESDQQAFTVGDRHLKGLFGGASLQRERVRERECSGGVEVWWLWGGTPCQGQLQQGGDRERDRETKRERERRPVKASGIREHFTSILHALCTE